MIQLRTSLFEENPFEFCKRFKINAGQPVPPGYRSIWSERDVLARAKLHSQLRPHMNERDYPSILLHDSGAGKEADFIEAHVFGQVHRSAVERVVGPRPKKRADLIVWKSVEADLKKLGATMEIT